MSATVMDGVAKRTPESCQVCGEPRPSLHRIDGRLACDKCFSSWARKQPVDSKADYMVKTLHNMILGPYAEHVIRKWLSQGTLSYTVEVNRSLQSQWIPVTQHEVFGVAAEEGRRDALASGVTTGEYAIAKRRRVKAITNEDEWQPRVVTPPVGKPVPSSRGLKSFLMLLLALGVALSAAVLLVRRMAPPVSAPTTLESFTQGAQDRERLEDIVQILTRMQTKDETNAQTALTKLSTLKDQVSTAATPLWTLRVKRLGKSRADSATLREVEAMNTTTLSPAYRDFRLNELALALHQSGQSRQAIERWNELVRTASTAFAKSVALTNIMATQQDETIRSQTASQLRAVIQEPGGGLLWESYYQTIEVFLADKKFDDADEVNRVGLTRFGYIPFMILQGFQVRETLHTSETAHGNDLLSRLFTISPDTLEWTMKTQFLVNKHQGYEEVARRFERWDPSTPQEARRWFIRALQVMNVGDYVYNTTTKNLLEDFKALHPQDRDSKELQGLYCWMRIRLKQDGGPDSICQNVVDPRVYVRKGLQYLEANDSERALEAADKALLMDGRSPWAAWIKAKALFNLNRAGEALTVSQDLVQRIPQFYPVYDLLLSHQQGIEMPW